MITSTSGANPVQTATFVGKDATQTIQLPPASRYANSQSPSALLLACPYIRHWSILTGISNSTEWSFTLPYEATFLWDCKGYNILGNYNWSVEGNYSITLDITPPVWKDNSTNVTSSTKYNDSVTFGISKT